MISPSSFRGFNASWISPSLVSAEMLKGRSSLFEGFEWDSSIVHKVCISSILRKTFFFVSSFFPRFYGLSDNLF